jgi:histone H3/H4
MGRFKQQTPQKNKNHRRSGYFKRIHRMLPADFDITLNSVWLLRHTSDIFIKNIFKEANVCAVHAGRVEVTPKDIKLALRANSFRQKLIRASGQSV